MKHSHTNIPKCELNNGLLFTELPAEPKLYYKEFDVFSLEIDSQMNNCCNEALLSAFITIRKHLIIRESIKFELIRTLKHSGVMKSDFD